MGIIKMQKNNTNATTKIEDVFNILKKMNAEQKLNKKKLEAESEQKNTIELLQEIQLLDNMLTNIELKSFEAKFVQEKLKDLMVKYMLHNDNKELIRKLKISLENAYPSVFLDNYQSEKNERKVW